MAALRQTFRLYTGAEIPAIGLGTWKSESHEVSAAVRAALDIGYRHIDGAAVYGNEKAVGEVYASVFKSGQMKRTDVFLCSKLWNTAHHPDRVKSALDRTLSDLQLDYLDLYLVHWPLAFKPGRGAQADIEPGVSLLDTWKAMEDEGLHHSAAFGICWHQALVDSGRVRHIGVSNFTIEHLQEILPNCRIRPAVNQVELHPYLPQDALVKFCHENQIHVTAYSSLGSGGTPSLLADSTIQEVAQEVGKTPAQVLLRWAVQRGISVIPKSVHQERLAANAALDFTLSPTAMDRINGIKQRRRYVDPISFWNMDVFGPLPSSM